MVITPAILKAMNETKHGDFRDEIEVTVPTQEQEEAAERRKQADAMWAEKTRALPPCMAARPGSPGYWEPTAVSYFLHNVTDGLHPCEDKEITFSFDSGYFLRCDPEHVPSRLEDIAAVGREMECFIQWFEQGCSRTRAPG